MKLPEYSSSNSNPYHFEECQAYCSKEKIEKAGAKVLKSLSLEENGQKQIEALVRLEVLRYRFGTEQIDLNDYRTILDDELKSFFEKFQFDIFAHTDAHDSFYEALNGEYYG